MLNCASQKFLENDKNTEKHLETYYQKKWRKLSFCNLRKIIYSVIFKEFCLHFET